MQALRKSSDAVPASTEAGSSASHQDGDVLQLAGEQATAMSPALALRDHLAARLDELSRSATSEIAVPGEAETKLPMATRATVILGLSIALWLVVYLAIAATI